MATTINGPNGGNGIIFGNTSGDDIINAFDFNNNIYAMGANDQINTGLGTATVHLNGLPPTSFSGVTETVNVGGANNAVQTEGPGHNGSTLTVQGGTGLNTVRLDNDSGFNNVALQGFGNNISVNSDATNTLLSGAGNGRVFAGMIGDDNFGFATTVVAAGQHNTVVGGDQNFTIDGGQGFDVIKIGNGENSVTEAGVQDKITVGGGDNTITDLGGHATVTVLAPIFDDADVSISLAGTNNTVTGTGDQNFTIDVTNGGSGKFTLGDGSNDLTTDGNNNTITMGTPDDQPFESFVDTVHANGNANSITLGNGDNTVVANGSNDTIKLGNGGNTVQANGANDTITLGNGGNSLKANGNTDSITVGNGNNTIAANGNNDTIKMGTGSNHLSATGDSDTISGSNGTETIALGSNSVVTLSATAVGTSIDSQGAQNTIVLNTDANASINDELTGGALDLNINGDAGNAGKIVLQGFGDEGDSTGNINLHAITGITNDATLLAHSTSDGAGGTLIHLGTGSLDLVSATINTSQFTFV